MSLESYQRDVHRHQQEIARLQKEKSQEAIKAAEESKKSSAANDSASRSTNLNTRQSKLKDVQRHQESAARHLKKVADLEAKIAQEQSRLADSQKRLSNEQERNNKRLTKEQDRTTREQERRMNSISGKLTDHDRLHKVALAAIDKLQQLPERITVLFLAANPLDQKELRLDEEVRSIGDMIRKSEHRDAVRLESRWAARPLDLLQAINELKPRVVHFSGHGTDRDEIVFQDESGQTKLVSKEAIVQTMAAASGEIQLVFFNTCYSKGHAEAVVEHVAAAIGMNTSIGDSAARVFAAQFYSAIGFGLSVGLAFQQAKAALMLEGIEEESTPELLVTSGLNIDELILVQPAKQGLD